MAIYEKKINVHYLDVNEKNELTTRGFLKYMQEVSGEDSSRLGYGFNNLIKKNMSWIVLNWDLKVYKHPKCRENIIIKTWVSSCKKIFTWRDFEVLDEQGETIAYATSKWILKDFGNQTIVRFSPELIKAFDVLDKYAFEKEFNSKIAIPDEFLSCFEYTIQRRDIDTNHHVNNLYYIDLAYEALPDDVYNHLNLNNIAINYIKEIKYKDKIKCFYSLVNNEHIVTIKNENLSEIHAIIKIKPDM